MTISTTLRRAGPFVGNGLTSSWPFDFKVFDEEDLLVVEASDGVETELTYLTDYTVTLNPDQDDDPGGNVTYLLGTGDTLVILSDIDELQPAAFTNAGGFYPRVVERSFDRLTVLIQQLSEKVNRTLRFAATDNSVDSVIAPSGARAGLYLSFDAEENPVFSAGTGADAGLREDMAANTGTSLMGHILDGVGAVADTVLGWIGRRSIDVEQFMTPTQRADALAGTMLIDVRDPFQAAIDHLMSKGGGVLHARNKYLIGEPLDIVSETGAKSGITIQGQGSKRSVMRFDYDGDYAIKVHGCEGGAAYGNYILGGGFEGITIEPAAGRTILSGIEMIGWRKGRHTDVWIERFHNNVYVPLRPDLSSDVDEYNSVNHKWDECHFYYATNCNVLAENEQGHASWRFFGCANEQAEVDGYNFTGGGWRIQDGSNSYNGMGGAGYGVRLPGSTTSTTNVFLNAIELDGNRSGALYFNKVSHIVATELRVISRRHDGADCSPKHITINDANPAYSGRFLGNYHRIDTETGYSAATTLYDFGTGAANNVVGQNVEDFRVDAGRAFTGAITNGSPTVTGATAGLTYVIGQTVTGTGIPSGTTITNVVGSTLTLSANATATNAAAALTLSVAVTNASNALALPLDRNRLIMAGGIGLTPDRRFFYGRYRRTQAWTTSLTALIGGADITGWDSATYYDPATGIWTMPHNGAVRITVTAQFTGVTSANVFLAQIRRATGGGALASVIDGYEDVPAKAAPGRHLYTLVWHEPCLIGDQFQVRVQTGAGSFTPVQSTLVTIEAV